MGLHFLVLVIGVIAFVAGYRRIGRLEAEIARLRDHVERGGVVTMPATAAPATVELEASSEPTEPHADDTLPEPEPLPLRRPRPTIESLIGGQLPIWVGGAALVIAAFFLVRYSIDSGLLGPGVRVALAAIFSVALIVAGEAARRLPATRDDPRIGQVLSGAGVASAYGTLYVAAAEYALVGPLAGFAVMIAITAGALFLALRHGAPTAIMALIGGFAAPLVAGFDAAGLGPLLVYLALLIAALFALAAYRGWRWLALAALVAGFGWANLLIVLLGGRDTTGVGGFVVALAIGATLALPRTGATSAWLRAAPIVAGMIQLLVLAPTLDFGPVAWSFHLVLGAAALILARRDGALLPAALAAACVVTVLVAAGLIVPEMTTTPIAAAVATLLFGTAGLAFSRRAAAWAAVALIGIAGPLLVAHLLASRLLGQAAWTALECVAAGVAATLAWRHRDRADARDAGLVGGSAVAATLASVALVTGAGAHWTPLAVTPVLIALGWWAHRIDDHDLARLPTMLLAAMGLLAGGVFVQWMALVGNALVGTSLTYPLLPLLEDVARIVAGPVIIAAALFAWPRSYGGARPRVAAALAVVATLCLYTLAKQPLAIADATAFLAEGLVERAAITLAFAAAGVALTIRTRFRRTGVALLALALLRFVWFDLLLLNPLIVAQRVGSIPVINATVLLPALLGLAAWRIGRARVWRWSSLALAVVAVTAAVRQIAHGSLLTGPLGSGETWGYSAALLVLAIAWLWRSLVTHRRDLRVAALALLTLVTIKVFLLDVAALGGVLRILSFLGLGLALIGIGWAYNRLIARAPAEQAQPNL